MAAAPEPKGWMWTPQSMRHTAGSTGQSRALRRERKCRQKAAWRAGTGTRNVLLLPQRTLPLASSPADETEVEMRVEVELLSSGGGWR